MMGVFLTSVWQIHLFPPLNVLSGIFAILASIAEWVVEWGPLFAAAGAVVVIYRFFIKKPALVLEAEVESSSPNRPVAEVLATPTFYITNYGRKFAEDAYLEFELLSWQFQHDDDDGKKGDPSTFLDIESNMTAYLGSPRRRYRVLANKPIQPKESYKLFYDSAIFERNRKYEIEYKISCRDHGPREGSIEFHVGHREVDVAPNYPKWWRRYLILLSDILTYTNPTEPDLDLLSLDIEWEDEKRAFVTALVKNEGNGRAQYASATLDVFNGSAKSTNFMQGISNSIMAFDPGEFWRFFAEVSLEDTPLTKDDISMDISVHSTTSHLSEGWDGVHLVDYKVDLPDTPRPYTARVNGRVENINVETERSTRIVAKFCDADGVVMGTEENQVELDPGEASDFRIQTNLPPEISRKIDDCKIVLMG